MIYILIFALISNNLCQIKLTLKNVVENEAVSGDAVDDVVDVIVDGDHSLLYYSFIAVSFCLSIVDLHNLFIIC